MRFKNNSRLGFLWLILFGMGIAPPVLSQIPSALSCLITPSKTVQLASPVVGVVEQIYVSRGDRLKKDQVVLTLKSELERVVLKSAQAQVEFYERKIERNKALVKQNLVSGAEQDELMMELALSRLKLNEAESNLALKTIKSPMSGVVHQKMIEVGELVNQKPVVEILQLNPLFVELLFEGHGYNALMVGQTMRFSVKQDQQALAFEGVVTVKDSLIDAASETFGVRVEVDNHANQLIAGLKCQLLN